LSYQKKFNELNVLQQLCPQCAIDPTCHSIYIKGHSASDFNIPVVYTKPGEATMYDDTIGIVRHFRGVADTIHPNPWIWVFDGRWIDYETFI